MSILFIAVLKMSLTAAYVAIIVMALRLLLKKAPKIFSYMLWGIVFFRLVCPISFESTWSLIPGKTSAISYNTFVNSIIETENSTVSTDDTINEKSVNGKIQPSLPLDDAEVDANNMDMVIKIASVIWVMGIVVLLEYSVMSYIRLKNRIFNATLMRNNIFETDRIQTPFVLGLIKPRIYIPTGLDSKELDYIVKHEQIHIKRGDYLIKPIAFLTLILHWFNPLIWLSYSLMLKDMEMSCDEAVIKQFSEDIRINYSTSLLVLSMKQSGLLNLAFGENNVKSRIKNVLNYKKPTFWIIVVAVVLVATAAISLASNPINMGKTVSKAEQLLQYKTEYVGNAAKVGNIIMQLDYPDHIFYDHFELDTDSPPYGVTVHLKTDPETFNNFTSNIKEPPFMRNAIIMFSLIGNADHINFNLSDGQKNYLMEYPRNWANAVMGKNVYEFTQSKKEFAQYLEMVEKLPLEGDSIGIIGGADAPVNTKNYRRHP